MFDFTFFIEDLVTGIIKEPTRNLAIKKIVCDQTRIRKCSK